MKLGEALNYRKYLTSQTAVLVAALVEATTVLEGVTPNPGEDTAVAIKLTFDNTVEELEKIVVSINQTNNVSKLENGMTIMEAIARRDTLTELARHYQKIYKSIRPRTERNPFDQTGEKTVYVTAPGIDAVAIKAQWHRYAKELRELDTLLQAANWTVDLL